MQGVYIKNSSSLNGKIAGVWKDPPAEARLIIAREEVDEDKIVNNAMTENQSLKILFVGDLMFDRYIREVASQKGNNYIFEPIDDLLNDQDLVVANLEGPITSNESKSIGTLVGEKGHLIFTFDLSLKETLSEKNIKVVNFGNNHILNFGTEGFQETKLNLDKVGLEYFGDINGQSQYLMKTIESVDMGFINYNQFSSGSEDRVFANIRDLKDKTDILVVYTHWGEEYKTQVPENVNILAHKLIDEGADLVIGTHPHVVEPKEEYRGKMIYYSLGNFVFDQYFSEETKKGMAVEATINPSDNRMEFRDIQLELGNNGQTRIKSN